ncbi:integrase arm-type DNA-binding domain-containing protein [Aeromonas sp. V90_14]|uniref:integrase arm-type DNA-binding domain-containing protein n=1 Tax=Aeromonas sp. V90_14 TaxID=3044241 RepID=UPI00249DCCA5|nr:integrase arm-type DNA-binding domain-containing protein [Aeromonas sp. V90_14]MDI3430162.1 integrase arm-type DNA-binding domain-containing protein [Aeromonas sp. V90_14]
MSTNKLTDSKLRTAKPEEKEYNLGDGEGLSLRVKPNGAKLWLFNYYRPGDKKRANISFGPYPDVTLAMARERRSQARALLAEDIDPQVHQQELIATAQAKREATGNTFERMATLWLDMKRHDVSEDYANDAWRSLEMYILPFLGAVPISEIRAPRVIELLRPLEVDGKLETVRRLCQTPARRP